MSTRYKTQCPRCQTIYPMPDSKLGQAKARANCGKCHHTFFLNSHLIEPTEEAGNPPKNTQANTAKPITATPPTIKPKKSIVQPLVLDDALIDDNTPTTDNNEDSNLSFDGLDDFLKQDVQIATPEAATKAKAPDGLDDEAWLDDLLKDNSPKINTAAINTKPSDDLSKIIGADFSSVIPAITKEEMDKDDLLKKIRKRIDTHAPTQEQLSKKRSPLWNISWLLGCVAMIGLMALQYTLFNLETIVKTPAKAEILQSVCGILPCNLPTADKNAFDTSYELNNGVADFTTSLAGNLKNTSSNNQFYPNLKISIQGHDRFLGDFIATPDDYLADKQQQIAPSQNRRFLLTIVDISKDEIATINIEPFY